MTKECKHEATNIEHFPTSDPEKFMRKVECLKCHNRRWDRIFRAAPGPNVHTTDGPMECQRCHAKTWRLSIHRAQLVCDKCRNGG